MDGETYFAAILRDVSASRRATRALRLSEERFRELAASAPVGIFQTDAAGRCIYVNARWSQMAGMPGEVATGDGWFQAVHPADRAQVQQAWQGSLEGLRPFDQQYRFVRSDGAETWVVGRAVASLDSAGSIRGFLGTVTDVTDRHHQALALEQARAEAETAARAKSLFLANMSHEIRTPLNAVIGMTTLLLDTPMTDEQRDFARTIRSSSDALLAVINDILDYSKADVGKVEVEHQAFDLRRCIEDSLDLVAPQAAEKRLNLAYLIEDDTPQRMVGDAARLRQILVNLLSNAVKFTHQGEVFLAVHSESVDPQTHRVHFAVHDSGIGIAAEHLPRLFQSFTQVDPSTTRKYGGTGLGLAISKRLAELMGGTVTVQSAPGQGSTFRLQVLARAALAPQEVDFLQRNAPALVGKRVLIVDDNLTNRRVLTRLALLWGMVPATLPSALEALDRVRHGEVFDLDILDIHMPDHDGMSLAHELRRHPGVEELPVVMLTSLGQRAALAHEQRGPLTVTLAKPIKAVNLYATLVSVLGGIPVAQPAPELAPEPVVEPLASRLPLRVLVAEDNPTNQRVALLMLRRLGYQADVASNGLEVIDAVEGRQYDVVLMDIQMPEMDGLQAARWIVQRRGPRQRPYIVAMTANAMPGHRETFLASGIDAYLPKPIDAGDLAAALRQVGGSTYSLPFPADSPDAGREQILDCSRLEHLHALQQSNQPSLVRELIDMFIVDSPGHLVALAQAVETRDAELLGRLAHRYLSVTQNIGAQRLSRICIDIERMAHAGQMEQAAHSIAALGPEHQLAQTALNGARQRYAAP